MLSLSRTFTRAVGSTHATLTSSPTARIPRNARQPATIFDDRADHRVEDVTAQARFARQLPDRGLALEAAEQLAMAVSSSGHGSCRGLRPVKTLKVVFVCSHSKLASLRLAESSFVGRRGVGSGRQTAWAWYSHLRSSSRRALKRSAHFLEQRAVR